MEEDLELEAMIRDALEAKGAFAYSAAVAGRRALPGMRRKRWPWAVGVSLMAASLAIMVQLRWMEPRVSRGIEVCEVISLVAEADGIEIEPEGSSSEDWLIAWQEAPLM